MIEFALATRFLVDYFWSEKWLSIVHVALFAVLLVLMLAKGGRRSGGFVKADAAVAAFLLVVLQSFVRDATPDTAVDVSKFAAFGLFYVLGRTAPSGGTYLRWLALGASALLGIFAAAAAAGIGYQYWGDVSTFAGGYFFKTDAALAILLLLAIVSAVIRSRLVVLCAFGCALFVVFKTNARIALPLVVMIPLICRYITNPKAMGRKRRKLGPVLLLCGVGACVGIGIAALASQLVPGILGFDLEDPFSDANTQGRTVIWAALIRAYWYFPVVDQLFGGGLAADQVATEMFATSADVADTRAHSSYMYMLLCLGVVGVAAFLWVLWHVASAVGTGVASQEKSIRRWTAMLACCGLVFFVMSFTVEAVIRSQIMIPLFMFFGVLVRYRRLEQKQRQAERAAQRKLAQDVAA